VQPTNTVDFSLEGCWDSPVPLWAVLVHFAILGLLVAAGGWLYWSRSRVRDLGLLAIVLVLLFGAGTAKSFFAWGILRGSSPLDAIDPRWTLAVVIALELSLFVVVAAVRAARKRRMHSTTAKS
jgi:hypothetical protein